MNTQLSPRFDVSFTTPAPSPGKLVRPRKKPHLEKVGSVAIPIYKTRWRRKSTGRIYQAFVIVWRDSAGRHKEKHANFAKATARAQQIGTNILNGQTAQNQFSEADRASYLRSQELLAQVRRSAGAPPLSLELAISEHVANLSAIGDLPWTIADCIRFTKEHQPKGVDPKKIPVIVQELLAAKRDAKKSTKWLGTLQQQLDRFAANFDCPLHLLQAREVDRWMDGLKVGLRTRANYFGAILELTRFAKAKGYLDRAWSELCHVEKIEVPSVDVKIPTPEHLLKILVARQNIEDRGRSGATLMPFLVLQAFAGIRHEEMHQRGDRKPVLDWSCVKLEQGHIEIKANVGKTKKRRLILIHPNLKEWLTPYAKPSGPVCELSQVAGAIDRAKKLAGVPSLRGELKNAFRKGFISYRVAETNDIGLTALEAGNSVKIIQENYRELATAAEAGRWFSISPNHAETLPLFAWAKDAS